MSIENRRFTIGDEELITEFAKTMRDIERKIAYIMQKRKLNCIDLDINGRLTTSGIKITDDISICSTQGIPHSIRDLIKRLGPAVLLSITDEKLWHENSLVLQNEFLSKQFNEHYPDNFSEHKFITSSRNLFIRDLRISEEDRNGIRIVNCESSDPSYCFVSKGSISFNYHDSRNEIPHAHQSDKKYYTGEGANQSFIKMVRIIEDIYKVIDEKSLKDEKVKQLIKYKEMKPC